MTSFFLKSLLLHISLVAFLYATNLAIKSITHEHERRNLKIFNSAVRVDVVSLPKLTLQEMKKMPVEPPPTEKEKESLAKSVKEKAPEKELVKKEEDPKLDKFLAEFSKKNIKEKEKAKEKKNKDQDNDNNKKKENSLSEIRKLIVAGNKLEKGSRIDKADPNAPTDEGEIAAYTQLVREKIKPHWLLPSDLMSKRLKCLVQVFISRQGELLDLNIFEGSGNEEFDQRAIQAIKTFAPFPPPPASIRDNARTGQVVLEFTPADFSSK